LYYNYYRYYGPGIGRYLRIDPSHHFSSDEDVIPFILKDLIINPNELHDYSYVRNNTINNVDFLGLATYLCKKPLDALQRYVGGKGQRTGPDVYGNLLYHAYLCLEKNGTIVCGGQTSVGGKMYGPGAQSNDVYFPSRCKKIAINKCIEDCILRKFGEKRPYYGLKGPGTNCQEWARETFDSCKDACF
jgi:RHS repeat-associated protein